MNNKFVTKLSRCVLQFVKGKFYFRPSEYVKGITRYINNFNRLAPENMSNRTFPFIKVEENF